MSPFDRTFSTASPLLALSPNPPHQNPFAFGSFPSQLPTPSAQCDPNLISEAQPKRPPYAIGRKRSRDEAAVNLDSHAPMASVDVKNVSPSVYSDASPASAYIIDVSNHSVAGAEKEASQQQPRTEMTDYPTLKSRKSIRIGESPRGTSTTADTTTAGLEKSIQIPEAPVIDDFTLTLGIGWRRISDDEHIQAAARGWARYIENHFPLTNVHIRLESSGLQSYLVEATGGFYLFAENLRQGRLVSTTVEGTLENLRHPSPNFEGSEALFATESPQPTQYRTQSDSNSAMITE